MNIGVLLFLFLAIFLVIGVPIGMSLGLAVILGLVFGDLNTPIMVVVQRMFTALDSFPLMAVPFFILSGDLMSEGGISKRLINLAKRVFGKLPASMSIITTVSSAFFGALSGSNPATVAAIGGIMIPEMEKSGYKKENAAANAAASGTLGVIIPPSISMVTYGVTASVSIGTMFIAGVVPGLLLAATIIFIGIVINAKYEKNYEEEDTSKRLLKSFLEAIPAILTPVIILGGIYSGIFTPTEAAAISVIYATLVALFVYKEITFKDLPDALSRSAQSTALILFIVACSAPFTWVITSANVPELLTNSVLGITQNKFLILLLVNAILLFLGMFLETQSIILLMTPILYPLLVTQLGVNPVSLGIILVVNTSIGMITPPMAVNLYVACGIADIDIAQISKAILPYLFSLLAILILITYIDGIILWLPTLLGA